MMSCVKIFITTIKSTATDVQSEVVEEYLLKQRCSNKKLKII